MDWPAVDGCPMKSIILLAILLAALWLWQYREIPVDRSWWFEPPKTAVHGDITVICEPGGCEGKRANGERVRL